MAKTYHEAYPEATIRIFDSASSIGGVWAKERLYPGLKTNNAIGSYEFSDFPMVPEKYGLQRGQHIPGFVVHQYLNDAAEYFDISGLLHFDTKVDAATRNDDRTWTITCSMKTANDGSKPQHIIANKLVVATGLTSKPFIPYIKGQELFEGPILHSRHLKDRADDLVAAQNVVVIGGNKSAWDVCYGVASSGRTAHMVLRPSGGGPSWVWPLNLEPFNTSLSSLSRTRFFTLFDPWPFDKSRFLGLIRQFLHQWALGRWITMQFWNMLGKGVRRQHRYDDSYNSMKLAPWYSVYWMGNSLGVHNYETSWFDLARKGNINIHIANIESISETTVRLSNDDIRNADALVCCTGW
jgi:cation diffusion facilitator CzcD-associated flavoprotein CzcO